MRRFWLGLVGTLAGAPAVVFGIRWAWNRVLGWLGDHIETLTALTLVSIAASLLVFIILRAPYGFKWLSDRRQRMGGSDAE